MTIDPLTAAAPTTPREALDAMRATPDDAMADHVRLFQSMPLADRLEFLFRTMVQLSLVQSHLVDVVVKLKAGAPTKPSILM